VGLNRKPHDPTRERLRRHVAPEEPPRSSDWREQERRAAEALPGGKAQPGSGNGWRKSRKGDGTSALFLESAKTTGAASLSLERAWLEEVTEHALPEKIPVLVVGFDPDASGAREDWAAFRLSDSRIMMRIVAALRGGDLGAARELADLL
jgi:hypothetical protein